MRRVLACSIIMLFVLPATGSFAASGSSTLNRQKCQRLTRQIERYEGVADMALQRGDSLWYNATRQQVERLEQERIARCPGYDKPNPMLRIGRSTARLMKRAASAARRYFTGGI